MRSHVARRNRGWRSGVAPIVAIATIIASGTTCLSQNIGDEPRRFELRIENARVADYAGTIQVRRDDAVELTWSADRRSVVHLHGYDIEVAVDGMDGWNAVRVGHYDLVITDLDMPRMTGFELVSQIKNDSHLRALPVMIVSYKGSEEDRNRGLEAGANYYLTKSSFHDETLLQAVVDLIGEA